MTLCAAIALLYKPQPQMTIVLTALLHALSVKTASFTKVGLIAELLYCLDLYYTGATLSVHPLYSIK